MNAYDQQERGDRGAYDRYLRGMDATMRQKVALTAAHLFAEGTVADMGMGSGAGSHALAALYPSLRVIGVDINPTMVELARSRYALPNLSFTSGDIAGETFPPESVNAIFNSSVVHHVTTFSGYDHRAAARALEVQTRQLKQHGMLIVRDFVDPGADPVALSLPTDDGDDSDDPQACSTARLFERFAREFRRLAPAPGFVFEEIGPHRTGLRTFRVPQKIAAEFVLRKDYRADWETEVLEEYTYFTQRQFEECFAALGLRVVASRPLWNPWIVRHRFEGKVAIHDAGGRELQFPPTNYLVAGEKVGAGEGVRFEEQDAEPVGFLSLDHYRNRETGVVFDLARRPHPTVDVLPWFSSPDGLFVLGRKSYPRPIVSCDRGDARLDGSTPVQYVTEPLNVLQHDRPLGSTVVDLLARCAAVPEERILRFSDGLVYYPSPGGIGEEVRSALVEIEPVYAQTTIEDVSRFSTSGHVRAIEATQLLRAAQVGGLPDARLEVNVYHLLRTLGRGAGPWIGDAIELGAEVPFEPAGVAALSQRAVRRRFISASPGDSAGFLELRCAHFREIDASGLEVAAQRLEFVVPRALSVNTIAIALLARRGGEFLIGVDDDDLPAAQSFQGSSDILVAPAWRLPRSIATKREAQQWIEERLGREYGVSARQWWELGGSYHPSPGLTPERVYSFAIEARPGRGGGERALHWLSIAEAIAQPALLRDGHLRVLLSRAAHALGLLDQ